MKRPFGLLSSELSMLVAEVLRIHHEEGFHIAFASRVVLIKFPRGNVEERENLVQLLIDGANLVKDGMPQDMVAQIKKNVSFAARASEAYEDSHERSTSGFETYSLK